MKKPQERTLVKKLTECLRTATQNELVTALSATAPEIIHALGLIAKTEKSFTTKQWAITTWLSIQRFAMRQEEKLENARTAREKVKLAKREALIVLTREKNSALHDKLEAIREKKRLDRQLKRYERVATSSAKIAKNALRPGGADAVEEGAEVHDPSSQANGTGDTGTAGQPITA
jgi:hypothetical protein